jgi:DNA-binding Lrp family transcriptional regulator
MRSNFTEEEFIEMWGRLQSTAAMAKALNISERNVQARRKRIEERNGIKLVAAAKNSPDAKIFYPDNGIRATTEIDSGVVMVASDCHYWPDLISTAHRAFVKLVKDLKPRIVCINGDAFDGASISRHPAGGMWQAIPSVKQELEACQDRLEEIQKAAGNAHLSFLWGNHDLRFNARIQQQVGDTFKGVMGMNLTEHFPLWRFSMSLMINGDTMIKHRYHNGIHAIYNNILKSGTSMVTGHLHSLKVTPFTDYNGSRYGVDTGTLSPINAAAFTYGEDSPANHRSGFAVLTFHEGRLMPPELCEVIDEDEGIVYFRGQVIKV